MKKLTIAALLTAHLAAGPATAAELITSETPRVGAFGGLRVTVPLDRAHSERPVRAGLALAPTVQVRGAAGEPRTRVGEGVEFSLAAGRPTTVTVAGTRLDRLAAAQNEDDADEGGIPTWGWIAGGVALLGLALFGINEWAEAQSE
ncbi:MAG: hypothetical protein ACXWU2_08750 [Allosphingosinicella sp.]